jgi:hypothetical protein
MAPVAQLACSSSSSQPSPEGSAQDLSSTQNVFALDGEWGADGAILTFEQGHGQIELGCASASIDAVVQTGAATFTGTGTRTSGSGVEPPSGQGPKPEDATFQGTLSGDVLTLDMTVNGETTTNTFTKGRQIDLIRCL